jgi:hypothetical protein
MPDLPQTCYVFSSFRDGGQDGLHLAWSADGLTWTAVGGNRSLMRPTVGRERLMRDPCVCRGPDGTFHMVWTDSWSDRTIGYARSPDLIHWSPQRALPVMEHEPAARNCWAPEVLFDAANGHFLIYWSTTIPGRFPETDQTTPDGYNHRIYSTTTADFVTFSPTGLFYDGGFNVIDATIFADGGRFHLIVKDEAGLPAVRKWLRVARGDAAGGPYTDASPPFTESWVEGPTVLRLGEWIYCFFDEYMTHRYGAVRSRDLATWEPASDRISFPPGTRHGSALAVPADVVRRLLAIAPQPLFRDPVYDGAADPVIVWNHRRQLWFMLYTNRRANVPGLGGVAWVHGTRIGIATSPDGVTWSYQGTADIGYGTPDDAHWAPDVVWHAGRYHMFLSVVPGMHSDWEAERRMVRLTSDDLVRWTDAEVIPLSSDRVIDASVAQLPGGTWRLWYNDERDGKSIHWADSDDLRAWRPMGRLGVGMPMGEGPKVFRWHSSWWLLVDHWDGFGLARSDDAAHWNPLPGRILATPGTGVDDGVMGNHADVVVSGDRAYVFYFTHPGRRGGMTADLGDAEQRRSSIQVAELTLNGDGTVTCDRDRPTEVQLIPPARVDV